MKNSLPKGWTQAALEDCCDVLDNMRIPVNSDERAKRPGIVPYYGATGQVGWIDDFLFDEEIILIGEDGAPFFDKSKAIAFIIDGKSWVNNHAHVLRANSATTNKFLTYFLNSFDYNGFVNGTTRLKLTQSKLREIPILLPPLAEQGRIVAKLDSLLARVNNSKSRLEQILTLLKNFRQSVLSAAVSGELTKDWRGEQQGIRLSTPITIGDVVRETPKGWKWETLIKLAKLESGHTPRKSVAEYWDNGNVPWISLQDIRAAHGKIIADTKLKPTQTGIDNSSARMLPLGTVVFSRDISPGFATIMGESMATSQHFANWICGDEILNKYLLFAFMAGGRHLVASGEGTTVTTLYMPEIKQFKILLPTLEEQKEIVRKVEELFHFADSIESRYQKAKAWFDKIPQALLAKAFRGELVPKDENDEPASVLLEKIKKASAGLTKSKEVGKKSKGARKSTASI